MTIEVISDTHGLHNHLILKGADVLVHCGDFSNGSQYETHSFLEWFSNQSHQYKIFIAGNHDKWFESVMLEGQISKEAFQEHLYKKHKVIYLNDESITIDGIKFYGSPYTPTFYNWSFMESEEALAERYKKIPSDTNVLITHGPPKGILDLTYHGNSAGSYALKESIEKLNVLQLHCFGHIHEGYGKVKLFNTTYINTAIDDWHRDDKCSMVVEL